MCIKSCPARCFIFDDLRIAVRENKSYCENFGGIKETIPVKKVQIYVSISSISNYGNAHHDRSTYVHAYRCSNYHFLFFPFHVQICMQKVIITLVMLTTEPPGIEHQFPTRRRVILACNTTPRGVLAPLGFDFLMIIFCTLYAWKTRYNFLSAASTSLIYLLCRSVPENFNEAKFIGFAMYTTCVIWVAFLPIYFGSESKVRYVTFSVFSQLFKLIFR